MEPTVTLYTVTQIASALGVSRRVAYGFLSESAADGITMVAGNPTKAWQWESLPPKLRQRLEETAVSKKYRNARSLLENPLPRWQPSTCFAACSQEDQQQAVKLAKALERGLQLKDKRPAVELAEIIRSDYRLQFGHSISASYALKLFYRTLERAADREDFSQLDLYLRDTASRPALVLSEELPASDQFDLLSATLRGLADPQHPSNSDLDLIWLRALRTYNDFSGAGKPAFKRALVSWLWGHVPGIAASADALRRNFDRKLSQCMQFGFEAHAITDGREAQRGIPKASPIPEDDLQRMIAHAAFNTGGRARQAIGELVAMGERSGLSAETVALLDRPNSSKSYVNRRVLDPVVRATRSIRPYVLGKQAIDDVTAYVRRGYGKLKPMDAVTADDFTMPVYFYYPEPDGSYTLTRGQCLMFIDCRSLKILGFSLQQERNYNSLVIRSLDNQVCRLWGVPRVKYFERGIWKNSKVVKNAAPVGWDEADKVKNLDFGWEQLGVKVVHTKKARSKPAELVGGLLQNYMERVLGYCGRLERKDCPEVTRKNKLAVEAGRIHPEGLFLSFKEWSEKLEALIELYNSTKQEGFVLKGLSPDEAFEQFWPHEDPPTKFSGVMQPLFAHWVSVRRVTFNGVAFKIGKEPFVYRNESLSAFVGHDVLVWFDPEFPETVGITDLKQQQPFVVERAEDVDFLATVDKTKPEYAHYQAELGKAKSMGSKARVLFKILRKKFEPTLRGQGLVSADVAKLAPAFEAGRKAISEKAAVERSEQSRTESLVREAQRYGVPPEMARGNPRLAELVSLLRGNDREGQTAETHNQKAAL